jgi:hypothetical protein
LGRPSVVELLCEARRQRVDVAQAVDLARLAGVGVDGLDELVILRERSAGEGRADVPALGRRTLPRRA